MLPLLLPPLYPHGITPTDYPNKPSLTTITTTTTTITLVKQNTTYFNLNVNLDPKITFTPAKKPKLVIY